MSNERFPSLLTTSRYRYTSALVMGACALLPACGRKSAAADRATAEARQAGAGDAHAPAVHFRGVEQRMLPPTLVFSGSLDAQDASEVAAQVPGVVSKVSVDVGSRVKKGDVLVTLDSREASLRAVQARATADQARERLGMAQGEKFDPNAVPDVRAAKEARDLAVLEADRAKSLVDTGALSQSAYDNARSNAERAKATYDQALANAKQAWSTFGGAQASLGLAQKSLTDTLVRAPFDGAVVERKISVGEYVNAGKVVATVVNDDPLRLRIDVPEADLAKVGMGTKVGVRVAAYPSRAFDGVIKRIGASVKTSSRTLPVEAEVPNHDGLLRPGFFARAEIAFDAPPTGTIFVPEAAIGTTGTSARVFVRSGNRVIERLVTPGRRDGALVEVGGTLTASDEVAIDNLAALTDGADVVVAP